MKLFYGIFISLFARFIGCAATPSRPTNVPASAVSVDGVFIRCSVETALHANRCAVYRDGTGEVLIEGLFMLTGAGREAMGRDLRYAAFNGAKIYLQDARALYPVLLYRIPAMENRLKLLAGDGAVDCGRVMTNEEPNVATNCALLAFANKRQFYVYYDRPAVDSVVTEGLAVNSNGEVYGVEFHSYEWLPQTLPSEVQLSDGNHIIAVQCPKPVNLRKTWDGKLTCTGPVS